MQEGIKTMSSDELLRYLKEKLKGKEIMSVEIGDTILIKEVSESFEKWAAPIWKKAREEKITAEEINRIIQEVRNLA